MKTQKPSCSLFSHAPDEKTVAFVGNPNVGKSTLFNALTGMHQHTGNWTGKTVESAAGRFHGEKHRFLAIDLPGTYSLYARSAEEEVTRNAIRFDACDLILAVCDATCLARNLHLVLQILEQHSRVLVCVNLMDEAKRRGVEIDLPLLSKLLGVRVVGISARSKKDCARVVRALEETADECPAPADPLRAYPLKAETMLPLLEVLSQKGFSERQGLLFGRCLLEDDESMLREIESRYACNLRSDPDVCVALASVCEDLRKEGIAPDQLREMTVSESVKRARTIADRVVYTKKQRSVPFDRKADRILTSPVTGYAVMLLLLCTVLWLTVSVSNYPSALLSSIFVLLQSHFSDLLLSLGSPEWLRSMLSDGVLGVVGQVVSVMLPPMAIFFPLFTILEEVGYLPRVAYNLDRPFACCNACGKQALTTCMGFGCNAVGVVGCRIIDSPRERMLAILTNSFVPCNGRFPALITILTVFFVGMSGGFWSSALTAIGLGLMILLGLFMTLCVTKLLSCTVLRGMPSSFVLELPPYRPVQVGRVLIRSLLDRTLSVLGRAVTVAAPMGLLIWILANVTVRDVTLLSYTTSALDPFATLLGMDGVILMAFVLGFPANEIVIPLMIMAYGANGQLHELAGPSEIQALFTANGWTPVTALCVLIFFLFHWPCSTTLLTVKKETGSFGWTLLAALLPTLIGMLLCIGINAVSLLFR